MISAPVLLVRHGRVVGHLSVLLARDFRLA